MKNEVQELRGDLKRLRADLARLESAAVRCAEVVDFYANPETYFAVGFFPDPPCGEFMDDFSETELGTKPGRRAREALEYVRRNEHQVLWDEWLTLNGAVSFERFLVERLAAQRAEIAALRQGSGHRAQIARLRATITRLRRELRALKGWVRRSVL